MPHFFEYEEKECGGYSMEIEEAFGKVLRKKRNDKSLSQEELAYLCDLDRTYISLMERGKRKPTINTLFALATGLDILPSSMLIDTEKLMKFEKPSDI